MLNGAVKEYSMEINATEKHYRSDPAAGDLIRFLKGDEAALGLEGAQLYYDFPLFKDMDGVVVVSQVLLISPNHGVIAFGTSSATSHQDVADELEEVATNVDEVLVLLYSRLIRNKSLRSTQTALAFPSHAIVFAPYAVAAQPQLQVETKTLFTYKQLGDCLREIQIHQPLDEMTFAELVATVEGAKGIIRRRTRTVSAGNPNSKGSLANRVESDIASFDQRQKYGYMTVLDGLQRIRGLAGSGKTIVLAMKAALTHLRKPDADILYTFYTKSLYQHIQRLITRFYRQFDDRDPDWSRLRIMHAWGGRNIEGVYYNACLARGIAPIPFTEAAQSARNPFDFVCKALLNKADIQPMYNYAFIDEGQDFPASFIRLCTKLAENNRVVFAYDDLQTIFQAATPTLLEIVGSNAAGKPVVEFSEDITLYKCYRNPREIIVCAHALGFGIYGSRIVQMLENREYWGDIGYKVVSGDFVEGSDTVIERPIENSLTTISQHQRPHELVQAVTYASFDEEVKEVAQSIKTDIDDDLRAEDILVVAVDDRNAKAYLGSLAEELSSLGIGTNNMHADPYGIKDFHKEGFVTLSTVHKAKGNEAFMVYVIGVDALFSSYASVRERNILFTAMTRAKGWIRVSGVGPAAEACRAEVTAALENFPYLRFPYPSEEQLKIMRRDLAEKAIRKQKAERMLDEVIEEMTPEEIERFMNQRSIRKGKNQRAKKSLS